MKSFIRSFDSLSAQDVPIVGGKNASLGEMIRSLKKEKILVPDGFATTADAFRDFVKTNNLKEKIKDLLKQWKQKKISLQTAGKKIRSLFIEASFSEKFSKELLENYSLLGRKYHARDVDVAVRSSATAEDLPNASFAGQQESFLNVRGEKNLLIACKKCYASLFTDRAIVYREENGFDHLKIALSIGIQKMVRSDLAGSGVLFTLDTETGFPRVCVINAAFGLGENVVQGTVNPDEYVVFKPFLSNPNLSPILEKTKGKKERKLIYASTTTQFSTKNVPTSQKEKKSFVLSDSEIRLLARWGTLIENHYKKPMDIEWAKDGKTNKLFIVQARFETVESRKKKSIFTSFSLKKPGKKILSGLAIGEAISAGPCQIIKSLKEIRKFKPGSILVTEMTSPDWVPIMKLSKGIITDRGGRTSHAAIVSRELGVPALVGCNNATNVLKNFQKVTLSCAEGDIGSVYQGILPFKETTKNLSHLPKVHTQIMMNISSPFSAFLWWQLPCQGIGLARMEFIIENIIKIHPMALAHFEKVKDQKTRRLIAHLTEGFSNKEDYFVNLLSQGIAKIAASQYPNPVIVRMSDFKTNEYASLIGGKYFEEKEENPMLGFRGASRYYNKRYEEGFSLECQALKKAREQMGFHNIILMIPFCRTPEEADNVLAVLKKNGLERGKNGLQIYVMCEIPSNILLAKEFSERFDGFSIGSNDLTQLILGIDRDSQDLAPLFDARNDAVKKMIQEVIRVAHKYNRKVGICGQAPSDDPDFATFLIDEGIDSLSLNPDCIVDLIPKIAQVEKKHKKIPLIPHKGFIAPHELKKTKRSSKKHESRKTPVL